MSDGRVAQALSGGVLTLTLERAAKRNALDTAMVEGLHAGMERAGLDAQVRVVCLRGAAYQMQVSPVENEKGEIAGTVLAFRDFEEEKKTDELKTEVVNVVSHELRTPLTAIRNALSLLGGPKLGTLSPGQSRFVDLAQRNVDQLIGIINDLLDLSKIEAGKLHLELAPTSLGGAIEIVNRAGVCNSYTLPISAWRVTAIRRFADRQHDEPLRRHLPPRDHRGRPDPPGPGGAPRSQHGCGVFPARRAPSAGGPGLRLRHQGRLLELAAPQAARRRAAPVAPPKSPSRRDQVPTRRATARRYP